jgi:CDP-4-dehydro-6-deoxyglucose reductase, E1
VNSRFPLAVSTWGDEELDAMKKVIDSGIFTMGKNVNDFEQSFSKFIDSEYCVMVNSGSSANLLMIAALFFKKEKPLQRGDEVIVPAVSWSTSYFPLQQYGLKLRFVDIDIESLNFDLEQLEAAITPKTKLILAVNLLGNPNDFKTINEIIYGTDIILLEDNCESLGAIFQEKYAGTYGLMGSFSTFFSHHISTMEGGLIVTDNKEIYHILLTLRAHGWTRNLPHINEIVGEKSKDAFDESFRFVLPGYNVRPLELEGAIGLEQLKKLPSLISERRKNGINFQKSMEGHPDLMIQKEIGQSSWFGFSIVIRQSSSIARSQLNDRLLKLGFETRPIVSGDFSRKEVMKYFHFEVPFQMKNAEYIDNKGLFVGNHHFPMNEAIEKISQIKF